MAPKIKKAHFQDEWLQAKEFSSWLARAPNDPYSAYCKVCMKSYSLSNMGRTALTSHVSGKKHLNMCKCQAECLPIKSFIPDKNANFENVTANSVSTPKETEELPENNNNIIGITKSAEDNDSRKASILAFVLKNNITRAEILWCLHTVAQHFSIRGSAASASLFEILFPNCEEASKMQLGRTKISYFIIYGIAPYFKQELFDICSTVTQFVIGFDESLNKIAQRGQMDIYIRFWDPNNNEVSTRYYTSAFLGHATAEILLEEFIKSLTGLDLRKLLHVSMDGPNVNVKFFRLLKSFLKDSPDSREPVDIGSCGLHAIRNAFKTGIKAVEWDVVSFLRALHNLFNNVPTRRADFIHHTQTSTFPLKFCCIRWLENATVAERAISIIPSLEKYIEACKKNNTEPECTSYRIVCETLSNKLLKPKLAFFQSLAASIEPFLRFFQSNAPLAPFIYEDIIDVMKQTMTQFVKADILVHATDITKIDLYNEKNSIPAKEITLSFSTREAIRSCKTQLKDKDILLFRVDCRKILQSFCKKLLIRSSSKYSLTKAISCLDPRVAKKPLIRKKRFSQALDIFIDHKWISGTYADKTLEQFEMICCQDMFLDILKNYEKFTDRLDHLRIKQLIGWNEVKELVNFLQMILILSHGNASLERGFSLNPECLVENLKEESLISQRLVYDTIVSKGGIDKVDISKPFILSCRNSHDRYNEALKNRKIDEEMNKRQQSESKIQSMKLRAFEARKKAILEDARTAASEIEEEICAVRNITAPRI